MIQSLAISGVYTSSPDGVEYVTGNGNPYIKVLLTNKVEDLKIYDSFFFTEKAHWRAEGFFKACGVECPPFNEITSKHFQDLVGKEIRGDIGKDKRGYDKVFKHLPAEKIDHPVETPIDEVSEQTADDPRDPRNDIDDDLLEEVPF